MIDAKKLLDQFLGAQGAGQGGAGQGGITGAERGLRGSGLDIGGALGKVTDYARANPGLAAVVAGGLATVLLGGKDTRRVAGGFLKAGGLAVVTGLAYKAYRDYQERGSAQPAPAGQPAGEPPLLAPPADSPFAPANAAGGEDAFAAALVTAMIAAAKADGHVDDDERRRIVGKLSEGGLTAEEQSFLAQELAGPADIEKVVRAAKTREQAVQLYAASFMAITPDDPAERGYLDMLAARLGLEKDLAATIEQTVAQAAA